MATTLDTHTVSGVLPFTAYVQVRQDGRWTSVASGTTPEWLRNVAADEATIFRSVRIVSQYGTVLETTRALS
jgi:hypothetical protein